MSDLDKFELSCDVITEIVNRTRSYRVERFTIYKDERRIEVLLNAPFSRNLNRLCRRLNREYHKVGFDGILWEIIAPERIGSA